MKQHYSFPSIERFKNAIHKVSDRAQYVGRDENNDPIYNRTIIPPVLQYEATTKLHGTNFAMGRDKSTGETWFQSRENIITPDSDNAGSARFFSDKNLDELFNLVPDNVVVIYGEWCGGSIQKKVALAQLPKMLVVFDVYLPEEELWLPREEVKKFVDHNIMIYNIYDYPTWDMTIDFSTAELFQNQLITIMSEIESCCPVAKALGVEGIGEGAVWRCVTPGYEHPKFRFKVKGEEHAGSKVKTLPPVDDEKVRHLMHVAEMVTPTWRLEQMLQTSCDLLNGGRIELQKIPIFMKALAADILKEESVVLEENGVTYKDIVKYVSTIGRRYFMQRDAEDLS